jgi:hypothetical protein
MFGYQLEGYLDTSLLEPESIPLIRSQAVAELVEVLAMRTPVLSA